MRFLSAIWIALLCWGGNGWAQALSPEMARVNLMLRQQLAQAGPAGHIPVQILLADRVDIEGLYGKYNAEGWSQAQRVPHLLQALQAKSAETQGPLLAWLQAQPGLKPGSLRGYWIANVIEAALNPAAIAALSQRSEVAMISYNAPPIKDDALAVPVPAPASINGREAAHDLIGASQMWAMGYTGYNRKALIIDSGVEGTHPSLQDKFAGRYVSPEQAWYIESGSPTPLDCDGHGTHVAGTIVGLNRATNDTIGVAPEGLWMGAPGLAGGSCPDVGLIPSFQWALNPDGDPNTTADMPDVINNSWNNGVSQGQECIGPFREAPTALEAAGVAVVFSAGNNGPNDTTITSPKNINVDEVNTFAVGNLNSNISTLPISFGSSRGPSTCASPLFEIKPEVVAPGTGIRSSYAGGGFASLTGTSMAAPQVAGAILLLKEAFPQLMGADLKRALYYSATDLGDPGEDNTYGRGLINLPAAFQYLINQGHSPQVPDLSRDVVASGLTSLSGSVCLPTITPLLELRNAGTDDVTTMDILIGNPANPDTLNWSGTIFPGGTLPLVLPTINPGTDGYRYQVKVLTVNGAEDYRFLDNTIETIWDQVPAEVSALPVAEACANGQVLLQASPDSVPVRWYQLPDLQEPVSRAATYLTDSLQSGSIYYLAREINQTVGRTDFGQSANFGRSGGGLRFDCFRPFVLKTVEVFCQSDGVRVIRLVARDGTTLAEATPFLTLGIQTLELNFPVPVGSDLELVIFGTDLQSNPSGSNYPYEFMPFVSIKGPTAPGAATDEWPYFFNWQIEGESCPVEVQVNLGSGAAAAAFSVASDTVMAGTSLQFTDQSTGSASVSWDFGDGGTAAVPNPTYTYANPGAYQVALTATAAGGCVDVATDSVVVTPSNVSAAPPIREGFRLLTLAGRGQYRLVWEQPLHSPAKVTLWNQLGQPVGRFTVAGQELSLDLSAEPAGMYWLQVDAGATRETRGLPLR
jgi:subtilisin family serine protease